METVNIENQQVILLCNRAIRMCETAHYHILYIKFIISDIMYKS